ncbi:MAG: sorbosone dehydrogenase family protein [Alphaproteobacteria bacterium]|nr:sorbosone dehydrogenase family protein [Alphaproteobacteria bacterium]
MTGPWRRLVPTALTLLVGLAVLGPPQRAAAIDPDPMDEPIDETALETSLAELRLPPGFHISLVTGRVPKARSLAVGARGTIYAGTRQDGTVYEVIDQDGDWRADKVNRLVEGLFSPNGVAFRDGALYIAEIHRLSKIENVEARAGDERVEPATVAEAFPLKQHHGWKFIRFGPDGKLYVPVGAPCNVCALEDPYGTIQRINPDGTGLEVVARGVRNSVGFDFDPATGEIWFTDNGRDRMGDDIPADELNHAPTAGLDFGFPRCHGGDVIDPRFGAPGDCERVVPPAQKLGPHVAALGMRFYGGTMFPPEYREQIFIAEHGSWDRTTPIGYRISIVRRDAGGKPISYDTFIDGWLANDGPWGRPVDLEILPDGSMLISDDLAGAIYRVTYEP